MLGPKRGRVGLSGECFDSRVIANPMHGVFGTDNSNILPLDPKKNAVFGVEENYVKANLVRPVGAFHMHRKLVAKNLI